MVAGVADCFPDQAFSVRSRQDGPTQLGEHPGVTFVGRGRLVIFEALGELVSVVEDVLHCARHGYHLRNFSRALIAWTMTTVMAPSTTPIS